MVGVWGEFWASLVDIPSGISIFTSFGRRFLYWFEVYSLDSSKTMGNFQDILNINWSFLGATSHTRLKAHDYGNVRALIGWKGGECSSLLHTRRWRLKGPKQSSWMKGLHGVLHGMLWIRVHGLPEFASSPPSRGGPDANSNMTYLRIYCKAYQGIHGWGITFGTKDLRTMLQKCRHLSWFSIIWSINFR